MTVSVTIELYIVSDVTKPLVYLFSNLVGGKAKTDVKECAYSGHYAAATARRKEIPPNQSRSEQ